jgi:arylsulfatase A-like enzyme
MTERPNVLLIVTDQMRRDALGANGNPAAHTPHLDRLAAGGVNFTRAYSACPSCIAARATLMTGLRPARHGFTGYDSSKDWRYKTTLAGTFANAGYHTQAVGKMHVQPGRNLVGFHNVVLHDGFLHDKRRLLPNANDYDDYLPWLRERLGPDADIADAGVGCNGYAVREWPWDERWHPSSFVTTKSIEFLHRRDPTKPFFLKVSYHRPHTPYDPPRSFWDMHKDAQLPEPVIGDWVDWAADYEPSPWGTSIENPQPVDRRSRDRARRAYNALVSQIDYELNRLFMVLGDRNLLDNTLVLFTSDHGDMLYDHNLTRKAFFTENSAGIPFILRFPRHMRDGRCGVTCDRLTELRDVFPTLCDACGVDIPQHLDGRSLLRDAPREHLHGEHPFGHLSNQWLTDGHEKYAWISESGRELLFDLDNDPRECHDLSKAKPDRVARWRDLLVRELTGRPEGYTDGKTLVTGRHGNCLPWAGTDDAPEPFRQARA